MVSTPELDTLVDLLTTTPGIYGARLVGGGFGGGVLALVDRKTLDRALPEALAEYEKRTGLKTEWDSVETGDGAEIMPAGGQAEFVTEWLP